ncbi:hypothetical protein NCAS_0F00410 [Naumovozyma castellii]|uniref:ABC transporter domain-containing protein n=2 Tax=Naumovozyma castellii TaxID=27288 RepID=G0VGA5_NAUCA|nr:hypothetical protein NCAS_0F00410 [Naumovozyma castellii CBS 4309]CCC70525.1 hypothetical protein NCAS_0F00410 [Naumovozyma castellii CBS 4309]
MSFSTDSTSTRDELPLVENNSLDHPYMGFDKTAQDQIRDLARTLTQLSVAHPSESAIDQGSDVQSIYSTGLPGINPVYTNPDTPGYDEKLDPASDNFSSTAWVKNMANIAKSDPDFYKPYSLGCVWKNLSASGDSADVSYQATILNMPWKIITYVYRKVTPTREIDTFQILKSMDGILNPGELLVVLGRPGSGCTTLLKSISSNTHGFDISKDSIISYNGLTPKDIRRHYRGEVVYNAESDIHLPHLTVYQTLLTVARLKTPSNRIKDVTREDYANHLTQVTMATYGLLHTRDTKVGDDLVKGVSGGERKRVSIAEVSICGSKVQCWDNATRGLDSATALEFIRALKTQATILNTTATVAIYQCSQDTYDLFDKVCVLDDGYQLYYGPSDRAKKYFQDMGYVCPPRQTTADFLTSVTSPTERILNQDMLKNGKKIPQTPREMGEYWLESPDYQQLMQQIDAELSSNQDEQRDVIREAHIAKQSKRARPSSPYVVSYMMQVKYLLIRNYWRIKQRASVTIFQVVGNSVIAFILGSMFYKVQKKLILLHFISAVPLCFFAILFNAFSSLLEIFTLFEARPITEKHRTYSLYHPSADAFASVLSEVPAKLVTSVCFNIIYYFLVNFKRDAGIFFFYFLISIVSTFALSHLFRCNGSLSKTLPGAMVPASMLLLAISMYTGFAIPETKMLGWSKWIWYINPLAYLFESLMINEFHDRRFPCAQFIPAGPPYQNATGTERVCAAVGSVPGQDFVNGDIFLLESYGYQHKHKWRGFGVGMAFVVFFFFGYLILCEYNEGAKQRGEMLIFPQNIVRKMKKQGKLKGKHPNKDDIEAAASSMECNTTEKSILNSSSINYDDMESEVGLSKSEAIFHWRNLCYEIPIKKEIRHILNNIDGWVKPGTLTALMGASGAGKTTLLDCLAQRVTVGTITGDVFVNGCLRDESFPRSIGYCQQQDLHLKTSTVRESLRFSAYLRQPFDVPVEEKNKYVEEIIKTLEMETYADAVVGVPGEGLNVEQRKRLTIGVELAAKPKLLVFLDEPTSGLDSQTAWATCQLMKKLAQNGQAILCTIHQPSAILMQNFDRLLFLQKGGETVYFGDLGSGCQTMIDYFEKEGAEKCPPEANPAEWMLQIIGAAPGSHAIKDFHKAWRNSEEYKAVQKELDWMEQELPRRASETTPEEHKRFATSVWYQFKLVSVRLFQQYWRSPEYLWSKYLLTVFNETFIGFTFFKADRTMQGLQNQMLATFMFTVVFNPLLEQYLPGFVEQRGLYEARERPSRTFSWIAFILSQIVVEIPWNFVAGTIAYFIYYYAIGFYMNASAAGQLHERGALYWLLCTAFFVYIGSMAVAVISFIEIADTAGQLASLLFTMALSFCGVMVTPSALPRFWIFMYRISPLTYLIDAFLSVGIANVDVECASFEFVQFSPPPGMDCGTYMAPYIQMTGTGYLSDSSATDTCHFCQFSHTNDFLKSVGSDYSKRWRNWGIFICYIAINYIAAVSFYYLARVPKSTGEIKEQNQKTREGENLTGSSEDQQKVSA